MLNNLDLFKVKIISELIKSESLLIAAKNLKITSSAISQNIKNIKRTLGKPLFVRVGKSIKPTQLALDIEKISKPFFSNLNSLLENSNDKISLIKVGAPLIFGSTILLDKLEIIRKKYSRVQFSISLLVTNKIIEELYDCKIDFGFIDDGPHIKNQNFLTTSPVWSEELILCCSQEFYRNYLTRGCTLKILKGLPHLPYHEGKEGVYKWYSYHYNTVPDLNWNFSIDSPYGVLNAILKGWGLGVIPKHLTTNFQKNIYIIQGTKPIFTNTILLAQNLSKVPTKTEKEIIKLISDSKLSIF